MLSEHSQAEVTYRRYLPDLQGWIGWFALVRGEKLGGVFPTHEAATAAWMAMYGPVPALIRRIERTSAVAAGTVVPATEESKPSRAAIETITPAEADARLTVSNSWALADSRRRGQQDYAA
jgi:hypothetical protein